MTDLTDITTRLGTAYKNWKSEEKVKDECRKEFFDAISFEDLGESYAEIKASSKDEAIVLLQKQNPGWLVDDIREIPDQEGVWQAILVEDPNLKAFTFVNPEDGMVYTRQVSAGPTLLDDERLQQENPDLWRKVTVVPYEDWIKNVMYHCNVDGNDIDEEFESFLKVLPDGPERKLVDLNTLDPETLAALAPYVYEGKPTVKLAPPRKAKPEELE